MKRWIIYESEFGTVYFHTDEKIIHHEFKSPGIDGEKKNMLSAGLEVMRREGAVKWLSDDRNSPIMDAKFAEWARTVWEPTALASGWAYWAIVMPAHVLARMNIDDLVTRCAELGLTVRTFDDSDEAYAWLREI